MGLMAQGEKMTQKSKSILWHWAFEFTAGLIVACLGAALIYILPEAKQGSIQTSFYTGSPGWAVVILGVLGMGNSVRRAIFKKKV